MSLLDGDKHTYNVSSSSSVKFKDDLTYNPATRNITVNPMESMKRMTKTMSIHRQKKVRLCSMLHDFLSHKFIVRN